MRDSAFMSSHPTGVPAGLPELNPIIVNQSPELAARRGFEGTQYEEDLHARNQLFDKQPVSMDQYGGIAAISYRTRDQDQISPSHASAYMSHNQDAYANTAMPPSFGAQNAAYSAPQETQQNTYTTLEGCGRVLSWQPHYGPPGTEVRLSLLTQMKIDATRQVMARFARDETVASCQGGVESTAPFRYMVTVNVPAQSVTQWSRPKPTVPFCLFVPYEGMQTQPEPVGNYNYTDTSAAASPSESEMEAPRRQSTVTSGSESPRHGNEISAAQLPPIRGSHATTNGYFNGSNYSNPAPQNDYASHPSSSTFYGTPSMASSYGQTPGCTPPTPSWAGTSASSGPMEMTPSNAMVPMAAAQSSTGGAMRTNPVFVRARNDQVAGIAAPGVRPASTGFNPYSLYPNHKANIQLIGNLSEMTQNWTPREKNDKRRLVQFNRTQEGSVIHAGFEAVDPDQRQQNATVISCIWWEPKNEFYVTSVDTISLLERLVTPDAQFTVEEKNRIRRNLEGFHPETVSKNKPSTEGFFKQIMNFPMPRPRHIEKDVKVFKWQSLEVALRKIIGKYTASYASTSASGRAANRHIETQITQEPHPRAPLPLPYTSYSQHQQMPMSATSSNFSDGYTQNYQSYSQPQTPSYPTYPQQHQYHNMPENGHMILQQHRPSVAYPSYIDNHNAFLS